MVGAVIMVLLLVIVVPVGVLMSGAVMAGVIGSVLKRNADVTHEGSELIELNN